MHALLLQELTELPHERCMKCWNATKRSESLPVPAASFEPASPGTDSALLAIVMSPALPRRRWLKSASACISSVSAAAGTRERKRAKNSGADSGGAAAADVNPFEGGCKPESAGGGGSGGAAAAAAACDERRAAANTEGGGAAEAGAGWGA